MISLKLVDEEYPFKGFNHTRKVARAILLFEDETVLIHEIFRDDVFCKQGYLETPGGGVDEGESFEQAVKRECEEETGYEVEVGECIGEVEDAYNLIGRKNINRFYLCKPLREVPKHFESEGDSFIQATIRIPLSEAIKRYREQDDHLVAGLVKRRELPILEEALRLLHQKPSD